MKKFLLLIFCMAAMLTSYAQPPASYDFEALDVHGNTLRYKITDATRNQVKMVQLKGTINGPLDIPAQVENGGVTYNVVGAVGFFSMCASYFETAKIVTLKRQKNRRVFIVT